MREASEINMVIRGEFQDLINRYLSKFQIRSNGFRLPEVQYEFTVERANSQSESDFFIGIPVKNQEYIISQVLKQLITRLTSPTEIGLLFDNCTDQSFTRALNSIVGEMEKYENLLKVHFLRSSDELFESTCENLLFELSDASYLVSFQADCFYLDETFFERSKKAFSKVENLLGISGRATVPLMPMNSLTLKLNTLLSIRNLLNIFLPRYFHHRFLGPFLKGVGYFGDTSGYPTPVMKFSKNQVKTVFIGQALIRGPIVWSNEKFRKLGGFNDISYFLGRDDCNLALQGLRHKFRVGYLPCEQNSNPKNGTTRKTRTQNVQIRLQERIDLSKRFPGELDLFWKLTYSQRRKFLKTFRFNRIII